ncbi:MAG TPA: NAD(P)/FAD-dependent oxidoreductase [Longimicrobiales bacterium]|nr:NAD(P)/FAD-dependent oxidoreductase [Longimicrobiales bacterium]
MSPPEAVVVGAGPNGLAAATVLAMHGVEVLVVEGADEPGGGARSAELTVPGFLHDVCSAVHPMAVGSPFLSGLPLHRYGLEWIQPPLPLAHPLEGGRSAILYRSLDDTAGSLGADGAAWRNLVGGPASHWEAFARDALGPLLRWPSHPFRMASFGLRALRSASGLLRSRFETEEGRALLAGCMAHSFLPLRQWASAAVGLVLAAAGHAVGWPIPRGGSGSLVRALADHLRSLGGEIRTGWRVTRVEELPSARAVLLDLTPAQVARVARGRLPERYLRRLGRYRYGPGAFKVDWALEGPVPWSAPACGKAATVHLGGSLEEIEEAERAPWDGEVAERPFVLFAEPSRFDDTRAPEGKGVGWAYCHVPHGWNGDSVRMVERIEARVERFAPGFRDRILARSVRPPADLEAANPNLVGGDINGGVQDLSQMLARPVLSLDPYATPADGLYLCSSSTPPGGGVHGMCGVHAARSALGRTFGVRPRV